MGVDKLIAAILRLPRDDLDRLLEALRSADTRAVNEVRESAASYMTEPSGELMTLVTVPLPDELAKQARKAGLLAGKTFEELLRRALEEHQTAAGITPRAKRRLVRGENGYLIVEALPGEKSITSEEVKKTLDDMEW